MKIQKDFWVRGKHDLDNFINKHGEKLLKQANAPKEEVAGPVDASAIAQELMRPAKVINEVCTNKELAELATVLNKKGAGFDRLYLTASMRANRDPSGKVTSKDLSAIEMLITSTQRDNNKRDAIRLLFDLLKTGRINAFLKAPKQGMDKLAEMRKQAAKEFDFCAGEEVRDNRLGFQGIILEIDTRKAMARIQLTPKETAFSSLADLTKVVKKTRKASREDIRASVSKMGLTHEKPEGLLFPEVKPKVLAKVDAMLQNFDMHGPYHLDLTGLSQTVYGTDGKLKQGLAEVTVRVNTPVGHVERLEIPVSVVGTKIYDPTIFVIGSKNYTLGQPDLDKVLGKWSNNKTTVPNPYSVPPQRVTYPNLALGEFEFNPHLENARPDKGYGIKR